MKMLGDVSEEYRELAKNLEDMEAGLGSISMISKETLAKCYVCLAHDWLHIFMEEEAIRLIQLAEKACPGYFADVMPVQTEIDAAFKTIAKNVNLFLIEYTINLIRDSK